MRLPLRAIAARGPLLLLLALPGCGGGDGGTAGSDGGADLAGPADLATPVDLRALDLTPIPTCFDGMQDQDETDVDCGGPLCFPCADGHACLLGRDCKDGICADGACAGPSCHDKVRNGDESDVDCGGSCPVCAQGQRCGRNADCATASCVAGTCGPVPTCDDGLTDGNETDVDCGGGTCPPCPNGSDCISNRDCVSGNCVMGLCLLDPTCVNGKKDGDETDVDCGGLKCKKCPLNKRCLLNADCQSAACVSGLCASKAMAGSYSMLNQAPPRAQNPPVKSCIEACADLFGGLSGEYSCSTSMVTINGLAWVNGFGDAMYCKAPAADSFRKGVTYNCGAVGCAYSAWVADSPSCDKPNYCFK